MKISEIEKSKNVRSIAGIVNLIDDAINKQDLYTASRELIKLKKSSAAKNIKKITVPRLNKLENLFDITLKKFVFDKSILYYYGEIVEVTPGFSTLDIILNRNKENIIRGFLVGVKKGDAGGMYSKVDNGIRSLKTAGIHWPELNSIYKSFHGRPAEDDNAYLKNVLTDLGVDAGKYGFE